MHATLIIMLTAFSAFANFYEKSAPYFFSATKLTPNTKYTELFEEPKGQWARALRLNYLNLDGSEASLCLFYFIPKKSRPGRLRLVSTDFSGSCLMSKKDKVLAEMKEVFNFKLTFQGRQLTLYIDDKELKYELYSLPLAPRENFATPIQSYSIPGVQLLTEGGTHFKAGIPSGEICKVVEDDCKITKDQCNQCSTGSWFPVFASRCSKSFSRRCGQDICGSKGAPACIRGLKVVGAPSAAYCINDSPFGFCQKGLRVMCENQELRCI